MSYVCKTLSAGEDAGQTKINLLAGGSMTHHMVQRLSVCAAKPVHAPVAVQAIGKCFDGGYMELAAGTGGPAHVILMT